jgi:hypothetical protein
MSNLPVAQYEAQEYVTVFQPQSVLLRHQWLPANRFLPTWVGKVGSSLQPNNNSKSYPHGFEKWVKPVSTQFQKGYLSVPWIARNNEASSDRVLHFANTRAYRHPPAPGTFLPCRRCLMTMLLQRTAVDAESLERRKASHSLRRLWGTMLMCAGVAT